MTAFAESNGHRGTVLVVDDEEDIREAVRRLLARDGYSVLVCGDPADAVELCRSHEETIHLLLTDALMPRMSGQQLATLLTRMRDDLAVLYMSGYPKEIAVREGIVEVGTMVLEKPFTRESLLAAVQAALV